MNILEGFFTHVLTSFADLLHGNYGWSVIVLTLLIRFCLLPLFMKAERQQKGFQEKLKVMQPMLKSYQEKFNAAKNDEERLNIQKDMGKLYKEHNVSPASMGILPMLIQMPILTGFYLSLRHSAAIAEHPFLWFSLGQPDLVVSIIAGVALWVQIQVSAKTQGMTSKQVNVQRAVTLLMPIGMMFFASHMPSAISLYWVVGSVFMIGYRLVRRYQERVRQTDEQQPLHVTK